MVRGLMGGDADIALTRQKMDRIKLCPIGFVERENSNEKDISAS